MIENPLTLRKLISTFSLRKNLASIATVETRLCPPLVKEGWWTCQKKQASHKEAMMMRNLVLGVGCKGVLNSIVCLYHEEEFMDSYFRNVA